MYTLFLHDANFWNAETSWGKIQKLRTKVEPPPQKKHTHTHTHTQTQKREVFLGRTSLMEDVQI